MGSARGGGSGVDDDDAQGADGHKYRVRPKALDGAAFGFAQDASWRLVEIVARLTGCRGVEARVLPCGTVRTELFVQDADTVARMLCAAAGGWAKVAREWAERGRSVEPMNGACSEVDPQALLPTWHEVVPGVDYKPGLVEAFRVRVVLRAALCACLPRGPVAVVPIQCKDGRGVMRLDLTLKVPGIMSLLVTGLQYLRLIRDDRRLCVCVSFSSSPLA
jgi:hypothetical protein